MSDIAVARKLLLDEMLSGQIAAELQERDHDVVAVVECPNLVSLPDDDVLVEASTQQRCLVTMNVRDFVMIDTPWKASRRTHCGLIYVMTSAFPQNRGFVGALVTALDRLVQNDRVPVPDTVTYLQRA